MRWLVQKDWDLSSREQGLAVARAGAGRIELQLGCRQPWCGTANLVLNFFLNYETLGTYERIMVRVYIGYVAKPENSGLV